MQRFCIPPRGVLFVQSIQSKTVMGGLRRLWEAESLWIQGVGVYSVCEVLI